MRRSRAEHALLYIDLHEPEKGNRGPRQARHAEPRRAYAYFARGIALADLGRYDDALRKFDAAISLDPDDSDSYHQRGLVRAKVGDHDGASGDFEQASQLSAHRFVERTKGLLIVVAPGSMNRKAGLGML